MSGTPGSPSSLPRRAQAPRSSRVPRGGWTDRLGLGFAWALGLLFCAIAAAIVIYMLVQGIRYVRPELLVTSPARRL